MTCPCSQPLPAPGRQKAAARVRIDHLALRRELGGVPEIREAMTAKATGRPSANVGVIWQLLTRSVYKSGDLPWLATREAAQNAVDAARSAIRLRQIKPDDGYFAVEWDAAKRVLVFDDPGVGMSSDEIIGKFLAIGESGKRDAVDSGEAAGGFGVAKAVILGCSRSFVWRLHTRDNLAVANGINEEVQVYDAPARQGTRLEIHDVDPDLVRYWDRARGVYVGIEDRLRELLAANDIPGFTFRFNGAEVKPMFSRRGGSRVSAEGSWGEGTTAVVKAYRRAPGDRGGAYYLRLNGLLQVVLPAQRGGLKADVVIDLSTKVRPGQRGYPFNAARDALQDTAAWTFSDLVDEVERENESLGASESDEWIDPEGDDDAGGAEIADQMAEAFADADVQRAIAEAAGGIRDFYGEQAKYGGIDEAVASAAPRGTRAVADGDAPARGWVLPAGMEVAAGGAGAEPDIAAPSDVQSVRVLRALLTDADAQGKAAGGVRVVIVTDQVDQALRRAEAGETLDGWQTQAVEAAIDRAAEAALAPGGGGLIQAVAVSKATTALDAITPSWAKQLDKVERRIKNPFGRSPGCESRRRPTTVTGRGVSARTTRSGCRSCSPGTARCAWWRPRRASAARSGRASCSTTTWSPRPSSGRAGDGSCSSTRTGWRRSSRRTGSGRSRSPRFCTGWRCTSSRTWTARWATGMTRNSCRGVRTSAQRLRTCSRRSPCWPRSCCGCRSARARTGSGRRGWGRSWRRRVGRSRSSG